MRYRQYKFKFYLDASHAIFIGGNLGERHPHTWEIAFHALKMQDSFLQFGVLEKKIEAFMEQYQNQYMNEIAPFDVLNPTLENCCEYFKEQIKEILIQEGWILLMVEMSETPTRAYVINLLDEESSVSRQSAESLADSILDGILKEE